VYELHYSEAALEAELPSQLKREEQERATLNATAPEGMVWIPGGKFMRGNANPVEGDREKFSEEFPAHVVEATGYKTQAEVGLKQEDFPQARSEDLVGGANVFRKTAGEVNPWRTSPLRWWSFTPSATWRTPEGPDSSIEDKMDHPVVCVNYYDAKAYAKWAGKRLPTEAEWERAARGGRHKERYVWGKEMNPAGSGKWEAPVKSYSANAWGLYDMAGNVWEICNDYYHPGYYHEFLKNPVKDPKGPSKGISDAERAQFNIHTGAGSFLCSTQYCLRFRPAARHLHEVFTPSQHTGFRCVKDVKVGQ